jgi:hypothetical protein
MVDAQLPKQGGMQIMNRYRLVHRLEA